MYVIEMPVNYRPFKYVKWLLNSLIEKYQNYCFINLTDSPINSFDYKKCGDYYCRKIENQDVFNFINESDYVSSYKADKLDRQGFTLNEYIETCLLFELCEIQIIESLKVDEYIEGKIHLHPYFSLKICPDGLNEIHVLGAESAVNDVISFLSTRDLL